MSDASETSGEAEHALVSERIFDRASQQLLDDLGDAPAPENQSLEDARAQMRQGQQTRVEDYPLEVSSLLLAGCEVELLTPTECIRPSPVIFFFHGGGWVMGDRQTHAYLAAELALHTQCIVAVVSYPLAPQTRYPQNLEHAYAAARSLLEQGESLGIRADRFAFAGDSAGGNLAAALTLLAKRRNDPQPQLQVLLYPALDAAMDKASHHEFAYGLNLTRATMKWFWEQYADPIDAQEITASPLRASSSELADLAPALIVTSEYDILRDEGEAYAKRLRAAGVEVIAVRFHGVLHSFMTTEALAASASGQCAIRMTADVLRRALNAQ